MGKRKGPRGAALPDGPAAPRQGAQARGAWEDGGAAGLSDAFRRHEDIKNARIEEPALKAGWKKDRRGEILEQLRERARNGGEGHAHALRLAESMVPNSTAGAWETLGRELARLGDADGARDALEMCQHVRVEVWQGMEGDRDVVAQVIPMGNQFLSMYSDGLTEFRRMLGAMATHMGPLRLDAEMGEHVVNMARFGSGADDWMVKAVIGELYLERGLFGEACGLCERMIGFRGHDRDRMRASTLIECVLNSVLGHLQKCEDPGYVDLMKRCGRMLTPDCDNEERLEGLKRRCLGLLVKRAESLGLNIEPDPKENNTLRKASDFALDVQTRRRILGAGEIAAHIRGRYPESCEFLGLGDPRAVKSMVGKKTYLAQNVSSRMEGERIARIRNAECPGRGALDLLEAMLRFKKAKGIETRALKKWRGGMLGDQLWDYMFEMDVYLRLVRAGADVETDVKIPKIGKKGMVEIDLRVDGCLAEVYAPLDKEIPVHSSVTSIEDPGTRMLRAIQDKCQLRHVGKRSAVVIVKCSGGDFVNVVALRTKLKVLLKSRGQPGAVFFVGQGGDRHGVECLVNAKAAARVPRQTIQTILKALALDAL